MGNKITPSLGSLTQLTILMRRENENKCDSGSYDQCASQPIREREGFAEKRESIEGCDQYCEVGKGTNPGGICLVVSHRDSYLPPSSTDADSDEGCNRV